MIRRSRLSLSVILLCRAILPLRRNQKKAILRLSFAYRSLFTVGDDGLYGLKTVELLAVENVTSACLFDLDLCMYVFHLLEFKITRCEKLFRKLLILYFDAFRNSCEVDNSFFH